MDHLVSLVSALAWPIAILVAILMFRADIRSIIARIGGIELGAGGTRLKFELLKEALGARASVASEKARKRPDEHGTEPAEAERTASAGFDQAPDWVIDWIASLSPTQAEIVLLLNKQEALDIHDFFGQLKTVKGFFTLPKIRRELEVLLARGIVRAKEGDSDLQYTLAPFAMKAFGADD